MKRISDWALDHRGAVLLFFALGAGIGLQSLGRIPIDAVPDVTPVQVVVNTKTGALDPEQIEKMVSYPIETEMSGIEGVEEVRSLSKYGLSQVSVIFQDGTDIYRARQQVSERLQAAGGELPRGLDPELAPVSTGLGEVFMYAVRAKPGTPLAAGPERERLLRLRTVQDFVIAPYLKRAVRNVTEVDSAGGFKKEIHIEVHPEKLDRNGVTIEGILSRLDGLGENFGGGYIQPDGRQVIVRATGHLRSLDEIRRIPIKLDVSGRPIPLSAVAGVREGFAQRTGGASYAGEEAVLGTVLMLSGANSRQVALDAERALKEAPLPSDVEIELLYSRAFLVNATLRTVMENLLLGGALVVAVLLLVLGNFRAALFVSAVIPLSMLFAAAGMSWFGVSASLMSLGAVDFGLLVDGAVVMIENALRRLDERGGRLSPEERLALLRDAAAEVVRPIVLGIAIIMLVYVPILSLEGIEGKLYHPMAVVVLMALAASLLAAVLLMPVLAYYFLKTPKGGGQEERLVQRAFRGVYRPILDASLHRPFLAIAPAATLLVGALWVYGRMGADFMPPLDEGDLVVNLTRAQDIGVDAAIEMQKRSERVIAAFPEVERVFSRLGTAEAALDPMPIAYADTFVILKKDRAAWPRMKDGLPRDKSGLYRAIKESLEESIPGQEISENQPIQMRFQELLEGSRADVTLRIYGKDLSTLMDISSRAVEILENIPGADEVEMDALTALRKGPVLSVRPDYAAIARFGLNLSDLNRLLETAMGGREVGGFYESHWRFPIVLRVEESRRENVETIRSLPVGVDGGTLPLNRIAAVELREEVTNIAHEGSERYAAAAVFLDGRDIASYVAEAKAVIERELNLPEGYHIAWGGQFKNLERARARLAIIVPIVLTAILVLLWKALGSLRYAAMVFTTVPLALTGGVLSLALRGIPLSVSASIGFIVLMGLAVLDGMVLMTFFNQLRARGMEPARAAREGALIRLRPVVVTSLVAGLGFLPMALNTGIGAEVQRPLATVIIGGLVSETLLTLIVLPVLYRWFAGGPERGGEM